VADGQAERQEEGRLTADLDREAVIRTWTARRRILERTRNLGIVIFLVAVFGVDFLLPASLAEHGVAVRIVLILALAAVFIAVQVKYCRCPKCDQNPGPKGPRSGAPAHVRNSPRFDMENWEACLKCGADLR
jgi:hypothetical protein